VLEDKEELFLLLKSQERVFCLIRSRDFLEFKVAEDWPEVKLIAQRGVGSKDFILISNR
jgi:hypothetical protein